MADVLLCLEEALLYLSCTLISLSCALIYMDCALIYVVRVQLCLANMCLHLEGMPASCLEAEAGCDRK